jgi:hypothetical protein
VANGLTSTDIGFAETGSTPAGESLQLIGSGNSYDDFTWSAPTAETRGNENTGQSITAVPEPTTSALALFASLSLIQIRRRN